MLFASFRRAVPQRTESPQIIPHANLGRFLPPAGQSCASAQIWPAVTRERGRGANVEKKAWGSKGQSPSRFFSPFLGGKKWGAMRPELKRENQSSAAGCETDAVCGWQARQQVVSWLSPAHRGTPHVGSPTEKQSPGLFFLPLLHFGKEKVRSGALPLTPRLRCRFGRRLVCVPLAHSALLKKVDENFQAAAPGVKEDRKNDTIHSD